MMDLKATFITMFLIYISIVIVGTVFIGSFTTHIRFNKRMQRYVIMYLNKSNRAFISSIFAFIFGVWYMFLFGQDIMDIMRVIFNDRPLWTMAGYVVVVNTATLFFGFIFYNAFGMGIKNAKKFLISFMKRRGQ